MYSSNKAKRMLYYMYMFEDSIRKSTNTVHTGGRGKCEDNGGVNLFTVLCTHVWNYHNESLCTIYAKQFKI
jgi:hypothetical protein